MNWLKAKLIWKKESLTQKIRGNLQPSSSQNRFVEPLDFISSLFIHQSCSKIFTLFYGRFMYLLDFIIFRPIPHQGCIVVILLSPFILMLQSVCF
jgi:hypothetical protein